MVARVVVLHCYCGYLGAGYSIYLHSLHGEGNAHAHAQAQHSTLRARRDAKRNDRTVRIDVDGSIL